MTQTTDEQRFEEALAAITATLQTGRRAPAPTAEAESRLGGLLGELEALYRFTLSVSQGDLEQSLGVRGGMASALKSLQASLRHLTWQTQRVAAGDFSQRVDFMGEFSTAFNSMVVALADARTQLAERNAQLETLAAELQELATHDVLTGVFNRRKLDELVAREIARARRYGTSLTLILLDVDHFKRVNDKYGHDAGDIVLVTLAELIRAEVRETEVIARWGGGEFVILAPGTGESGAVELAKRLRTRITSREFPTVGHVSASFGVAGYRHGDTGDDLFARADAALYRAKDGGRDRVAV